MSRNHITKTVAQTIAQQRLLKKGDRVLVAVSGGPDSVCLLHLLVSLRHALGVTVHAVHINHGLRAGSALDERLVVRVCREWQVPLVTRRIAWGRKVDLKRVSEELARTRRHKAVFAAARKQKADTVAFAHHQNDLAETVLMRLIRGTGSKGLLAMQPKTELSGIAVVRPLLKVSRGEIEQYLAMENLPSRQDPTNRRLSFLRNRVRHELIPLLAKKYNPNIVETLARTAKTLGADYEVLDHTAHTAFDRALDGTTPNSVALKTSRLKDCAPGLRRMILRLAVEQVKGDLRRLTATHIEELENLVLTCPQQSVVNLPGRISGRKKSGLLVIRRSKKA